MGPSSGWKYPYFRRYSIFFLTLCRIGLCGHAKIQLDPSTSFNRTPTCHRHRQTDTHRATDSYSTALALHRAGKTTLEKMTSIILTNAYEFVAVIYCRPILKNYDRSDRKNNLTNVDCFSVAQSWPIM